MLAAFEIIDGGLTRLFSKLETATNGKKLFPVLDRPLSLAVGGQDGLSLTTRVPHQQVCESKPILSPDPKLRLRFGADASTHRRRRPALVPNRHPRKLDIRPEQPYISLAPNSRASCAHPTRLVQWQVSQATSLQNLLLKMPADNGNGTHVGISRRTDPVDSFRISSSKAAPSAGGSARSSTQRGIPYFAVAPKRCR